MNKSLPHSRSENLAINSVVKSQFSYCLPIWMFTPRHLNNTFNSIHKRPFDLQVPFNRLEDSKQKCIHQKNIQSLAIDIHKFQAGLTPRIMSDLVVTRENKYNLRNFQALESLHKRTIKFGIETISYRRPQIWNMIPKKVRIMQH